MDVLRIGSFGPRVKQIQDALNLALPPPQLSADGRFGPLTQDNVRRFQFSRGLTVDGAVGPATFDALTHAGKSPQIKAENRNAIEKIHYDVPFHPQKTPQTCWAASTAMITKTSEAAVIAKTPKDLILDSGDGKGGLKNYSRDATAGLWDWITNHSPDTWLSATMKYARVHNLGYFPPMSWSVKFLRENLEQYPLMCDMLWNAESYSRGTGSPGHMIVIAGISGVDDQSGSGKGLMLDLQDPWPPNKGNASTVEYSEWIKAVSIRTYRVFYPLSGY